MTTSRTESQQPQGRRRSGTTQSVFRNPPLVSAPLKVDDSKVLNSWVHDPKESATVIFNQAYWPGVAEGDMLRVTGALSDGISGFLFEVPQDDGCAKPQLQISIPKPIADTFGFRNNGEVTVTKVDKNECCADCVEYTFQDQYLGRNEMWRLGESLVGQCVYTDQEVSFIGAITAKICKIYIGGKTVSAGHMTSSTKAIYRSLSARVTIFIQVCRELWEFAGDGERYNEKIVHSFLPALFSKWREASTNHVVTIVLISRVFYDQSEIDYAAGPLRRDEDGNWYKDFYKVITDLEVVHEWKPTLVSLKDSFWDFQRDILLTHHYHRAHIDSSVRPADQVRLVGRLSFAHDGPILEALNLSLNPTETHYVDRSLSLTGHSTILITPGTGYFRVSKQLLRLTTTRMLDQGFGLDLVSLAKPPLHQSPIFSFQGLEPELRMDREVKGSARALDPLWGGDDYPNESAGREKTTFWWEPFWISVTFWDMQMDLPFRADRFVARAKMHEIQMLGLLEHDVLSSIEVPFLPENTDHNPTLLRENSPNQKDVSSLKREAEKFDLDIFALKPESRLPGANRNSFTSSGSGTIMASSYRSNLDKRALMSHRNSIISTRSMRSSRIPPIEESPRHIIRDLPPEEPATSNVLLGAALSNLSTSPSQSSMRSSRSTKSSSTTSSNATKGRSSNAPSLRASLSSKFAPSWLFNPFRSGPSEPQASSVSASASTSRSASVSSARLTAVSPTNKATSIASSSRPVTVGATSSGRSTLSSTLNLPFDEETPIAHRASYTRHSPLNSPPRDEPAFGKRRSTTTLNSLTGQVASSSPNTRSNPSRPKSSVPYEQFSLARRWEHLFPRLSYKHEIKWKSMVTPACLPLTVEFFPTILELESSYDVFSYDFVVHPPEMRSFLARAPTLKGSAEEIRREWALVVMRGMAAVRLAQGFQFVLQPKTAQAEDINLHSRSTSFTVDGDMTPKPTGASEILRSTAQPVYLSMSNEIHRISYTGEAIQVRRYVRRMPPSSAFEYQCLIWPKLGGGYTELETSFTSHGLENYGWNRLDMLVAGYEQQLSESLRYWRTRFVVIPSSEPPSSNVGPSGENLDDEEIRMVGIEKLAEIFTKLRWQPPGVDEKPPAVRFLPTTLSPVLSIHDSSLIAQLDDIHATGPLHKKMKSERDIVDMSLPSIAKAMREEDGVPIKLHMWHGNKYPDSFTGYDFVSWLVREFRDVSSRTQAAELGVKLHEQGLFDHCKRMHGFLDGHYYYRLNAEYAVPMTPRGWFLSRHISDETNGRSSQFTTNRRNNSSPRRNKKQLLVSQSMVIDVDPNKRSGQAETVILHHDIIHNPSTVFHFELQWIGTTARMIEDQLRIWSRTIDRYGLKLIEAYVTQISDIRERNAFQSCFPVRLCVPPPIIPDLEKRIPEGVMANCYFEYALLGKFGFILDIEAADLYPRQVEVVYSYRRSVARYSQFVHRSGVAFVQVLGGEQGFLFLTNRMIGPGRMGSSMKSREQKTTSAADEIRTKLATFCEDEAALKSFYDEEIAALGKPVDEPPELRI